MLPFSGKLSQDLAHRIDDGDFTAACRGRVVTVIAQRGTKPFPIRIHPPAETVYVLPPNDSFSRTGNLYHTLICRRDVHRIVVVQSTLADEAGADALAKAIVERRLAACVQRLPVRSTYRWKGTVESSDEILLLAKTSTDRAQQLVSFIRDQHGYELPEIVVTPVEGGLEAYLAWVAEESAGGAENR